MNRILFYFVAVAFLFASCTSSEKEAIAYNDKITDLQRAIDIKEQSLINSFYQKDDSLMPKTYNEYMLEVKESTDSLQKLEEFDEDYNRAVLSLFNAYKSAGENEYRRLVEVLSTKDTLINPEHLLREINEKLNSELSKVKVAQEKFAKKYNIEVDKGS